MKRRDRRARVLLCSGHPPALDGRYPSALRTLPKAPLDDAPFPSHAFPPLLPPPCFSSPSHHQAQVVTDRGSEQVAPLRRRAQHGPSSSSTELSGHEAKAAFPQTPSPSGARSVWRRPPSRQPGARRPRGGGDVFPDPITVRRRGRLPRSIFLSPPGLGRSHTV